MKNFEYYNPVHIVFGKGQMAQLKKLIPAKSKLLLVYGGGSIKENGIYEEVTGHLKNFQVIEFEGVSSNPQYDHLMKGVELARQAQINFILAVGGGSVIDGAKFISAAINHSDDPWNILSKRQKIESVIPFGCVLTLPATGSEMNSFSVISKGADKLGFGGDPRLYPKFSILDPTLTYSLPDRQLANGIVDAYVHVLEQYLTKDINAPIQDRYAEAILKTLREQAPLVMSSPDNYDARANLMWSATQALNGLIGVGVIHDWATHMIGHELTALYGIDHARTLAVVLPSLLRVQKEHKLEKLVQYGIRVLEIDPELDVEDIADKAIVKTEEFFNSLNVPTKLSEYQVKVENIADIVSSLKSHIAANLGEDGNIDDKKVTQILTLSVKS